MESSVSVGDGRRARYGGLLRWEYKDCHEDHPRCVGHHLRFWECGRRARVSCRQDHIRSPSQVSRWRVPRDGSAGTRHDRGAHRHDNLVVVSSLRKQQLHHQQRAERRQRDCDERPQSDQRRGSAPRWHLPHGRCRHHRRPLDVTIGSVTSTAPAQIPGGHQVFQGTGQQALGTIVVPTDHDNLVVVSSLRKQQLHHQQRAERRQRDCDERPQSDQRRGSAPRWHLPHGRCRHHRRPLDRHHRRRDLPHPPRRHPRPHPPRRPHREQAAKPEPGPGGYGACPPTRSRLWPVPSCF